MIIDACMYAGELDVLLVRLHELGSVVDKFVIVEALEHHGSNRPRTATLAENWPRIKELESRIKYVVIPKLLPPHQGPDDSWPRENFHRNALLAPIVEVAQNELGKDWMNATVLVSDCDEIPRAATLRYGYTVCYALNQDFFYYDVTNYLGTWNGTVVTPLSRMVEAGNVQSFRNARDIWPRIYNAGWHFSMFGGLPRIKHKLANFAHACEDSSKLVLCRADEDLLADIAAGRDIYHRPGEGQKELRDSHDARLPFWLPEGWRR